MQKILAILNGTNQLGNHADIYQFIYFIKKRRKICSFQQSPLYQMLSLSELGLRLWKSDESIAALLQSWIRFLLQSPKAGAADILGCETCPFRTRMSPKAAELMLFCEISLTGESLDTGLQGNVFWLVTGTANILSMW